MGVEDAAAVGPVAEDIAGGGLVGEGEGVDGGLVGVAVDEGVGVVLAEEGFYGGLVDIHHGLGFGAFAGFALAAEGFGFGDAGGEGFLEEGLLPGGGEH